MTLKVLIVDDERRDRTTLIELCEERNDVQIVGEAECGVAALRAADELRPDVMLVDEELPDMSGIDLLSAARGQGDPLSIIVTGRPNHAAAALAAGAIDYLPKPVDPAQLGRSLERAQHRRHSSRAGHTASPRAEPPATFEFPAWPPKNPKFLVGERQHRLYPLELEKIDFVAAQGNYVAIHSGACNYIRRDSIKRLAAYLADWGFMRIERSLLLNVRAVAYAQAASHGTFVFTLSSGACYQSSSSYREAILNVLPLAPLSRRKDRGRTAASVDRQ